MTDETIIEAILRVASDQATRDFQIIALLTKMLAELESQGKKTK